MCVLLCGAVVREHYTIAHTYTIHSATRVAHSNAYSMYNYTLLHTSIVREMYVIVYSIIV